MLTRTGLGVLIATAACALFGVIWRYEELLTLSAAGAIALVLAIYLARRPTRHFARRRLVTARVARGEPVRVRYQISNPTRRRLGPARLVDKFQSVEQSFQLPALRAMSHHMLDAEFPSTRRGVFEIGPLAFERVDQLGLSTSSSPLVEVGHVVVHPRVYPLPTSSGAGSVIANDAVMRRPSGDPLAGFQSLREYQYGDDTRLIHWPTSARTAALMVREFVDLRRHEFTVLIDAAANVGSADDFEEMVDVGASVAIFALDMGLQVVVRTTSRLRTGRPFPLTTRTEILDLLTPLQQSDGTDVMSMASLFTGGLDGTSVLVVTGPSGPSTLFPRSEQLNVVRIGAGADTVGLNCPAIAATDASQFVERWSRWT
ncbi:MAG: DUF58 domain-containing protein [Ilumatobacteraceae bacterium]